MAVRIRLTRTGARNSGSFRIVAADARSPRDGRFLEVLGWYAPRQATEPNFAVKLDRIDHWVSHGAQMTDTVRSLVRKARKAPVSAPAEAAGPESVPEPEAPAAAESAPEATEQEPVAAE